MEKGFFTLAEIKEIAQKYQDKQIVITAGFFDLIHPGHIRYLQNCRQMGDLLIVAVDCDARAKFQKGDGRPVLTQIERAEVIAAMKCVDYIYLHQEPEKDPIIELAKVVPNSICVQSLTSFPGGQKKEILDKLCKKLVLLPSSYSSSTTKIIDRIRATN